MKMNVDENVRLFSKKKGRKNGKSENIISGNVIWTNSFDEITNYSSK